MTHARYVLGGYLVTLGAVAVYTVALLTRLRAAGRTLPPAPDGRVEGGE